MDTKKKIIERITDVLRQNDSKEVVVKDIKGLRNGRWGMHAYVLRYEDGSVRVYPWAFGHKTWSWTRDLMKLTKQDLLTIYARACK